MPDPVQYEPAIAPSSPWRWLRAGVFRRIAAILLLAAVTAIYGYGSSHNSTSRVFFSPDTLDACAQREILLPGTRLPIFRSPPTYFRYPLVTYLVDKGYWSTRAARPPRWLRLNHTNLSASDGKADLYREFRWRGDESIAWSDRHPELAADLWPRVLARLRAGDTDRAETLLFYCRFCEDPASYHQVVTTLGEPAETRMAGASGGNPE